MSGRKFPRGTGYDFAGVIDAVGPGVDAELIGRRVWGTTPNLRSAMAAEYVCVEETLTARAPDRLDLVTAAGLPTVALTALLGLRRVELTAGQSLLIVGAAGGVGSAALQLAGALAQGSRVAAVCSAGNIEFCCELGAETAFDYADLSRLRQPAARRMFDAVLDLHGTDVGFYRRLVKKDGRIASLSAKSLGYSLLVSPFTPGPKVRRGMLKPTRADLDLLAGFVERGELRPVVDEVYPLEQIARAHRAVESGHSRGKRIIRIAPDGVS